MHASLNPPGLSHRLPAFFLLVFALSVPFWLIGVATKQQLMPGLSISALMGFCPMVAALILVNLNKGIAGVLALLKRSFDFKRIQDKRWLVQVLLLMPAVSSVVFGLLRWMDWAKSWAGLALQQHRQERVCSRTVSRHVEPCLHPVSS
jgi:hypothetical protein